MGIYVVSNSFHPPSHPTAKVRSQSLTHQALLSGLPVSNPKPQCLLETEDKRTL